ncbi:hypothetical protein [Pseudomonas sp. 24 R 17]|nr:hypothetical protein [Pseudomonas sp. 35 E 8]CRM65987.1 hypothetical protein [Pseudomonas sp. 24 R 17]
MGRFRAVHGAKPSFYARRKYTLEILHSAVWWKWIISVSIAFANLAILSMDEHFALLVYCDFTSELNGFRLSTNNLRGF